jgi:hypothetical protein
MGTTGDDDSIESQFSNPLSDKIQILRKASQTHFFNMDHLSQLLCPIQEIGDRKTLFQLFSTVAEEDTYLRYLLAQSPLHGIFLGRLKKAMGRKKGCGRGCSA